MGKKQDCRYSFGFSAFVVCFADRVRFCVYGKAFLDDFRYRRAASDYNTYLASRCEQKAQKVKYKKELCAKA